MFTLANKRRLSHDTTILLEISIVKKITCFLMMTMSLLLAACQTAQKPVAERAPPPAVKKDFLTLGRELSDGRVDLYQPGVDFIPNMTAPEGSKFTGVSPISGNQNILVNDPSVTIYSLDTMDVSEPSPAPLPPLQPPTSLQGEYLSPFDKNGNPPK